jgi:hypothetical protein
MIIIIPIFKSTIRGFPFPKRLAARHCQRASQSSSIGSILGMTAIGEFGTPINGQSGHAK